MDEDLGKDIVDGKIIDWDTISTEKWKKILKKKKENF